jgi:pectinesterase
MNKNILLLLVFLGIRLNTFSSEHYDIVVAKDGSGNFTSLTEAINNLPMYQYQRCVIYLKNGIYEEKIRIEQTMLLLQGEIGTAQDQVFTTKNRLADNKDFIGPAVYKYPCR